MLLVLWGVALYLLSGGVIGGAGYTNEALGFSFDYRTGPNGYVLQEAKAQVGTKTDFVTNIVLTGTKELAAFREQAEAREGPPTIGVMVFKNSQNLFPEEWAKENRTYSNIDLVVGDQVEMEVDGAKAVRYIVDGLYRLDTVVVAEKNYIYVFTGALVEGDSPIEKDFEPFLDSVRFVDRQ